VAVGTKPHELANHLLEFFAGEAASVKKVNPAKFTFKVDFFFRFKECTTKVRIFQEQGGSHAIEFRRYSGDGMAFRGAYERAAEHLKPLVVLLNPPVPEAAPPALPVEVEDEEAAELNTKPLLDLLSSGAPELQADAAAMLAEVVQDDWEADRLCTAHAFDEFRRVLAVDSLTKSVAYPMAYVLSKLAERPDAAQHFTAQQELVQLIHAQVCSTVACALVQQQFAQVLATLSGHSPAFFRHVA
jgi:hypothetical protein